MSSSVNFIEKAKIRLWSKHYRKNLFRVLMEIYRSDEVFSDDEREDLKKRISGMGIKESEIDDIKFQDALFELKQNPSKMRIARHWIVKAIFADEDFDSHEREFVNKMIKKYALNENAIKEIIKKEQD